MKKIIFILIFLLPILLLSCSSNNEAPLAKTDTSATSTPAPTSKPTPKPNTKSMPESKMSCPSIYFHNVANLIHDNKDKSGFNIYFSQNDCFIEGFILNSSNADLPSVDTKILGHLDDKNNIVDLSSVLPINVSKQVLLNSC